MFKKLVDPIVGMVQRMANGTQYIVLDSASYSENGNLACPILVTKTEKEINYNFERILQDARRKTKK